jgi:hypothetical protein
MAKLPSYTDLGLAQPPTGPSSLKQQMAEHERRHTQRMREILARPIPRPLPQPVARKP